MNFLTGFDFKAALIKIALMAIIISAAVYYFKYTQEKIDTLTKQIAEYQVAKETAEKTITQLKMSAKEQKELMKNLNKNLRTAEQQNDELRELFRKHNLAKLAIKKPTLIEKRINDATQKMFDDINNITRD
jgi:uncharacterized protein HemX